MKIAVDRSERKPCAAAVSSARNFTELVDIASLADAIKPLTVALE